MFLRAKSALSADRHGQQVWLRMSFAYPAKKLKNGFRAFVGPQKNKKNEKIR